MNPPQDGGAPGRSAGRCLERFVGWWGDRFRGDGLVADLLPRLVGGFGVLWGVVLTPIGAAFTFPQLRPVYLVVWFLTCGALVVNRGVRYAGVVLAGLAWVQVFWPSLAATATPQTLLGWFGLLLAVSEGCPRERALLIRVCVTCVYAFTALSKLNPAFLAGDQIVELARTREQLAAFRPLLAGSAGVAVAWLTVATEAWLAIGLWLRRTRVATAILGVVLHVVLVVVASRGWAGVTFLTVLNGGLVVGYLAFFVPLREDDQELSTDPGSAGSGG